jgi:outer membrane biosynthesis protein TonB/putative methionine-R-sulfoxide reductase with GAF domain
MANISATATERPRDETKHGTARRVQYLAPIIHRASKANASGAAIALVEGAELVTKASIGNAPDPETATALESSFTGLCVRTGATLHCADTTCDPRVSAALCEQMDIRSIVVVPLKNDGRTVGVLAAFASNPEAFSPADICLLEGLAEEAKEALWPCEANATTILSDNGAAERAAESSPGTVAPTGGDGDFSQILATIEGPGPGDQQMVEITDEEIITALAQIRPDARRQAVPDRHAEKRTQYPQDALRIFVDELDTAAIELTGQARPTENKLLGATGLQQNKVTQFRIHQAVKPARKVGLRYSTVAALLVLVLGLGIGSYFVFRGGQQSLPALPLHLSPQSPPLSVITGQETATAATTPTQTVTTVPASTKSKTKVDREVRAEMRTPETATPATLATRSKPLAETVEDIAPPSGYELIAAATLSEKRPRLPAGNVATPSLGKPETPVPPRLIRRIAPLYPTTARLLKVQGPVVLSLRISSQGKVVEAQPISGPELLRAAAISAVMQWTYEPASLNGNPVESSTRVEINFKLQ